MKETPVKKFVTKYCLTAGIQEMTGSIHDGGTYNTHQYFRSGHHFLSMKECFDTMEEAVKDANRRRSAKIESLEKQLHKIMKLEFETI